MYRLYLYVWFNIFVVLYSNLAPEVAEFIFHMWYPKLHMNKCYAH